MDIIYYIFRMFGISTLFKLVGWPIIAAIALIIFTLWLCKVLQRNMITDFFTPRTNGSVLGPVIMFIWASIQMTVAKPIACFAVGSSQFYMTPEAWRTHTFKGNCTPLYSNLELAAHLKAFELKDSKNDSQIRLTTTTTTLTDTPSTTTKTSVNGSEVWTRRIPTRRELQSKLEDFIIIIFCILMVVYVLVVCSECYH